MAEPPAARPPGPPSETVPSSFDSSPEFFEEKRLAKFTRRLREEPLIPLGCAATIYALYQASKSIRAGDHHQTNRMFRARIYAQGFTLIALVGGSIFWKDDRMKRKELEKVLEEKRKAEKREKWLRELEERDREDREWRGRFEGVALRAKEAEEGSKLRTGAGKKKVEEAGKTVEEEAGKKFEAKAEAAVEEAEDDGKQRKESIKEGAKHGKENVKGAIEKAFQSKSVLEQVESPGWGRRTWSVKEAWRRR